VVNNRSVLSGSSGEFDHGDHGIVVRDQSDIAVLYTYLITTILYLSCEQSIVLSGVFPSSTQYARYTRCTQPHWSLASPRESVVVATRAAVGERGRRSDGRRLASIIITIIIIIATSRQNILIRYICACTVHIVMHTEIQ